MITEDYVSFEVAKLLKENGFDVSCRVFYKDPQAGLYEFKNAPKAYKDKLFEPCFLAPSLYMAMKWLRTEKNIYIEIRRSFDTFLYGAIILKQDGIGIAEIGKTYYYYEETVNAALSYALKNLI